MSIWGKCTAHSFSSHNLHSENSIVKTVQPHLLPFSLCSICISHTGLLFFSSMPRTLDGVCAFTTPPMLKYTSVFASLLEPLAQTPPLRWGLRVSYLQLQLLPSLTFLRLFFLCSTCHLPLFCGSMWQPNPTVNPAKKGRQGLPWILLHLETPPAAQALNAVGTHWAYSRMNAWISVKEDLTVSTKIYNAHKQGFPFRLLSYRCPCTCAEHNVQGYLLLYCLQ